MKKTLLFACCFLCLLSFKGLAQIYPNPPIDSTTITFGVTDSLNHSLDTQFDNISVIVDTTVSDSNAIRLWQIGNTTKPVFSNGSASRGIMTDTLSYYPTNANSSFTLKVQNSQEYGIISNPLVEVWHEYQTDSFHAGGIIEFSTDSGATWMNIFDCTSIPLQNLITDTLFSGQKAFMGTSNGQQFSIFYFWDCVGLKTTQLTSCNMTNQNINSIYLRFRFQSDSTIDTLSGWKIDSIRLILTECPGSVPKIDKPTTLAINPNPAFDGIFSFPAMDDAQKYTIDIFNDLGEKILSMPYQHTINIGSYAKGLYFYKVRGNDEQYSGKLLYE